LAKDAQHHHLDVTAASIAYRLDTNEPPRCMKGYSISLTAPDTDRYPTSVPSTLPTGETDITDRQLKAPSELEETRYAIAPWPISEPHLVTPLFLSSRSIHPPGNQGRYRL
jgi:hypothetical protein